MIPDKQEVLAVLRVQALTELGQLEAAHQVISESAVQCDGRCAQVQESSKTEASYLAKGLTLRLSDLQNFVQHLSGPIYQRIFSEEDAIAVGALVGLEDDVGVLSHYLIVQQGRALKVKVGAYVVQLISVGSPMGAALIGQHLDDDVVVTTPRKERGFVVVAMG